MFNEIFDEKYSTFDLLLFVTVAFIIIMGIELLRGINKKFFCNGCQKEYKLKYLRTQNNKGRGGILLCNQCSEKLKNRKKIEERTQGWIQKL